MTLFFFTFAPSLTFFEKKVSLPIILKAALQKFRPAITPLCFAIIFALAFLSLRRISLVVISPEGLRSSFRACLTIELM